MVEDGFNKTSGITLSLTIANFEVAYSAMLKSPLNIEPIVRENRLKSSVQLSRMHASLDHHTLAAFNLPTAKRL